jgi:hypothetical protein
MKLEYIKADGTYYRPQEPGVKDETKISSNYPVCLIKKLFFGRWQIDYYDKDTQWREKGCYSIGDEDKPNVRLIVYPLGIEEIRWLR